MGGIFYGIGNVWLTRIGPKNHRWATWEKTNLKWKTKQETEIEFKRLFHEGNPLLEVKEVKTPREPETYIPVKRQIHIKK